MSDDAFTLVFAGDIRDFPNPLTTETPFGVAIGAADSDLMAEREALEEEDAQRLESRPSTSGQEISEETIQKSVRAVCEIGDPGPCKYPACECRMLPRMARAAIQAAQKDQP